MAQKAKAHFVDLKRKIVIYTWEGSEEALVSGDVFFRLLSNMSHGLQLLRQIEDNYAIRYLNSSTQLMILPSRDHFQKI